MATMVAMALVGSRLDTQTLSSTALLRKT